MQDYDAYQDRLEEHRWDALQDEFWLDEARELVGEWVDEHKPEASEDERNRLVDDAVDRLALIGDDCFHYMSDDEIAYSTELTREAEQLLELALADARHQARVRALGWSLRVPRGDCRARAPRRRAPGRFRGSRRTASSRAGPGDDGPDDGPSDPAVGPLAGSAAGSDPRGGIS